jgi:hypothetical protein
MAQQLALLTGVVAEVAGQTPDQRRVYTTPAVVAQRLQYVVRVICLSAEYPAPI